MSEELELPVVEEKSVTFPSSDAVTYQKIHDTVMKFVDLGGGNFTQDEIEDKMKDLTGIATVIKRVLPFLRYLGFMTRSRRGNRGPFTWRLDADIRSRLAKNKEEFQSIFINQCIKSPAYLAILKYAKEEKVERFLVSAFENSLKGEYSHGGLTAWLNALDKVKLLNLKEGFISLEGISPKTPDAGQSKNLSTEKPQNLPPDEGVAPGMNINVDLRLDYRQTPDLQREYMKWLDKMSSKPTVRMSIKRIEEGKESTTEKKTDQS